MNELSEARNSRDVKRYLDNLCGRPLMEQLAHSRQVLLESKPVSEVIEFNSDILESYYLKFKEKANKAPDSVKEMLWQELGQKFDELMERNQ